MNNNNPKTSNSAVALPTYKGYTVDYRLKQFRGCKGGWENHGLIEFIDFDSEKGDRLLTKMIKDGVADLDKIKL